MTWLAWRQFRVQAAVALAGLAVLAGVVLATGLHLRHLYDTSGIATCNAHGDCAAVEFAFLSHYKLLRPLLGTALLVLPALLGIFWGAPLLARELESGSYRLAWTQSITRTRWLAVKIALVGLASVAIAALLSLMVTWWSSPIDHVNMNRFTPELFDERGIVAIGYAAFAFALGTATGALLRRTLPAMAATLTAFVVVRLIFAHDVRPNLIAPSHAGAALSAIPDLSFAASSSGVTVVMGASPSIPNAWIESTQIVNEAGQAPTSQFLHNFLQTHCPEIVVPPTTGSRPAPAAFHDCIAALSTKFHDLVTYQPAGNYWPIQAYETAIFLGLALILTGLCFWWVCHRLT